MGDRELPTHGKQKGKANYSRTVATVLGLELSCRLRDGCSSYGFQNSDRLRVRLFIAGLHMKDCCIPWRATAMFVGIRRSATPTHHRPVWSFTRMIGGWVPASPSTSMKAAVIGTTNWPKKHRPRLLEGRCLDGFLVEVRVA